MGYMVHLLNNVRINKLANCYEREILKVVVRDFSSTKKKIEYSNRERWNHSITDGFRLIHESKTRFGT